MTERICRRNGMPEANIPGWVDLHWQCAAAMLEAGVMDEDGEWITDKDVRLGIEAYQTCVGSSWVRGLASESEPMVMSNL